MTSTRLITAFVGLSLLAGGPAAMAEQGNAWGVEEMQLAERGPLSDSKRVVLYTTDTQSNGIVFRCYNGKMFGALSAQPTDMSTILDDIGKARMETVTYEIEGEEKQKGQWLYVHKQRLLIIPHEGASRRLYNAAVSGKTVSYKRKRHDAITVSFPTAEKDAFSSFKTSCGLAAKN